MPRKGPAPKRPLVSDPVYGSQLVTQLVSKVLQDGKKAVAQRIVYTALEGCRDKTGTDPVVTRERARGKLKPGMLLTVAIESSARMSPAVPELAIIGEGSNNFVYVLDKGIARRVPVKLGIRQNGMVEVIEGLTGTRL